MIDILIFEPDTSYAWEVDIIEVRELELNIEEQG